MHLIRPGLSRNAGRAGFSLLETVIAAGLLLLTVAAVTLSVTAASRGAARLDGAMDADRAVHATAERLRVLPFCASAYPVARGAASGGQGGPPGTDLVAAVFPHAREAENGQTAWFVAVVEDGVAAGSFVTVLDVGGVTVRCVARFLHNGDALEAGAVDGWAMWDAMEPPAAALEVRVSAAFGGAIRSVVLTRSALTAPGSDPRSTPAP